MAGTVVKIAGSVANPNGGSRARIIREAFYADFYAGWLLGTDYPSALPTGSPSPEIGDFAFKGRDLAPLGATAGAKYSEVGDGVYYSLPFSIDDLVAASAGAGITLFGVVNFGTASVNRVFISGYRNSIENGTAAIIRVAGGQYYAQFGFAGGTGSKNLIMNADAYSGTMPELLVLTATTTDATLHRYRNGASVTPVTTTLTNGAPRGADNIRIGVHPVASTAGAIDAYGAGAIVRAISESEADDLYADLQTLYAADGVTI